MPFAAHQPCILHSGRDADGSCDLEDTAFVAFEKSSIRLFVLFYAMVLPHANAALPNFRDYTASIADEEWMEAASSEGVSSSKLGGRDECPQPLQLAQHQWLR